MEDTTSLIQEITSQFQRSGHDLQRIQKSIQDIRDTEKARQEMRQDARALLLSSRRNVDPESLKHEDLMIELDQQKFSTAKAIQDMDQDIASLEAEVHQLRMQSLELDSSGRKATNASGTAGDSSGTKRRSSSKGAVDQDGDTMDDEENLLDDAAHASAVLRLQLYRALGIEMLEDDLGVYTKARIRSKSKNDVHLVKFDDQLSPFYQTNLVWEFAS
ncbi:kinetochore-associated Ndc80 complex subunit spc24 [Lunasporangiospora selenospora]|uniref:Kinetochore protein Spc24 n=1 Tax=Lunasporangiospora selenospora TaxID=979761 RepID=A0A9P6G001_9FUNG|nr:kinetochore-associated Ndc80 complex subunit spc24 [Lunasporangiospora selenospora]